MMMTVLRVEVTVVIRVMVVIRGMMKLMLAL